MAEGTMEEALSQRTTTYVNSDRGSWFSRLSVMSSRRFSSRPKSSPQPTSDEKLSRSSRTPTDDGTTLRDPTSNGAKISPSGSRSRPHSRENSVNSQVSDAPLVFGSLD